MASTLAPANVPPLVAAIRINITAARLRQANPLLLTPEAATKVVNTIEQSLLALAEVHNAANNLVVNLPAGLDWQSIVKDIIIPNISKYTFVNVAEQTADRVTELVMEGENSKGAEKIRVTFKWSVTQVTQEYHVHIGVNNEISYNFLAAPGNLGAAIARSLNAVAGNFTGLHQGLMNLIPTQVPQPVREATAAVICAAVASTTTWYEKNETETYKEKFYGDPNNNVVGFFGKLGAVDPQTNAPYNLETTFTANPRLRVLFCIIGACVLYCRLASSRFEAQMIKKVDTLPLLVTDICSFIVSTTLWLEGVRDQKILARQYFQKSINTYLTEALDLSLPKSIKLDFGKVVKNFINDHIWNVSMQATAEKMMGQTTLHDNYFNQGVINLALNEDKKIIDDLRAERGRDNAKISSLEGDMSKMQAANTRLTNELADVRRQLAAAQQQIADLTMAPPAQQPAVPYNQAGGRGGGNQNGNNQRYNDNNNNNNRNNNDHQSSGNRRQRH